MIYPPCHCIQLRRASRKLTALYDRALERAGINVTQFAQLYEIVQLGAPSLGELARRTDLDRSTLGRNVRTLVRKGLVQFESGPDERTRLVRITQQGKRTLRLATPMWQEAQDAVTQIMAEHEHAIARLLENLESTQP